MILPPVVTNHGQITDILCWLSDGGQFRPHENGYQCKCCLKVLSPTASLYAHKVQHCVQLGMSGHDAERLARRT